MVCLVVLGIVIRRLVDDCEVIPYTAAFQMRQGLANNSRKEWSFGMFKNEIDSLENRECLTGRSSSLVESTPDASLSFQPCKGVLQIN